MEMLITVALMTIVSLGMTAVGTWLALDEQA